MNILIFIIVFLIVLFLYLHTYFHIKTSNDLEVYEIEKPSKDKLEEICDLKQPILFQYDNEKIMNDFNLTNIVEQYGAFDIYLRNRKNDDITDEKTELYIPFILRECIELFLQDKERKYITENNMDFLNETGLSKVLQYNDYFLRPPFVSKCIYDMISGSVDSSTPLRYNLNYRNYYLVTQGECKIKLIAPVYSKYLDSTTDYLHLEHRSPIHVWDVQDKYKNSMDKVKVLEMDLKKGDIIHIPAYWWYSIHFNKLTNICNFSYRTYANTFSILPKLCIHFLQQMNVKREIIQQKIEVTMDSESKDES